MDYVKSWQFDKIQWTLVLSDVDLLESEQILPMRITTVQIYFSKFLKTGQALFFKLEKNGVHPKIDWNCRHALVIQVSSQEIGDKSHDGNCVQPTFLVTCRLAQPPHAVFYVGSARCGYDV